MDDQASGANRYLSSLAEELRSQAQRVRDLIGSRHWLSDGYHKEELLRVVLRRHSPSGIDWVRGFVLSPTDPHECSREQDILAVDRLQEAPVFAQGDLLIAFPRGILAAISVKTTFRRDEVEKAVEGLNSVRAVAQSTGLDAAAIWCGAYFYTGPKPFLAETAYEWIVDAIRHAPVADPPLDHGRAHPLGPDVIALADDELFRVDYGLDGTKSIRVRGFNCRGLSTAMFLVNVLDHIAAVRGKPASDLLMFAQSAEAGRLEPKSSSPEVR